MNVHNSPDQVNAQWPSLQYPHIINPLTPNDLQRRRAVSPLKIKIPTKKSRQAALRGGI
jgi:hypothetical protein